MCMYEREMSVNIIAKGVYYTISQDTRRITLEDKTKSRLEVIETSLDGDVKIIADKGRIHDADGIGHTVSIRWYYPIDNLHHAKEHANIIETRYTKLRELTCPDD